MTDQDAYLLRENTGTTGVIQTAQTAAGVLAGYDTPHLIVGGIAVQEHGYPRVTVDVDLVVPDVLDALDVITAPLDGPFVRITGCQDRVVDRRNRVNVDLLPAGRVLRPGCKVPFPQPTKTTDRLQIVTLEELISLKLDSWANTPIHRHRDKTDVIELIVRRKLPRDLQILPAVLNLYWEVWDALRAET